LSTLGVYTGLPAEPAAQRRHPRLGQDRLAAFVEELLGGGDLLGCGSRRLQRGERQGQHHQPRCADHFQHALELGRHVRLA
jgi:hypothetical protein